MHREGRAAMPAREPRARNPFVGGPAAGHEFRVTLAELVARAAPGDSVAIPPDLVESTAAVTIEKSVQLFSTTGARLADTLVIRPSVAVQLTGMTRTGVTVLNEGAHLTARECGFAMQDENPAVVAGADSRLEFTNCRFTGPAANAVRLRRRASARIIDCGFQEFESPAVSVEDPGSAVELIGCRFSGMSGHAVLVEQGGQASLFDCGFDDFGRTAWTSVIAVSSGGRAELSQCRFAAMKAHGVVVRRGGLARVSDCRFEDFDPRWSAVSTDGPGSRAELSRCRFHALAGPAVTIEGGATVCVADSTVTTSGNHPAVVADGCGSSVDITHSRIVGEQSAGVAASAGAQLTVSDCSFDTALGAGLLHGNITLDRDGSQLRLSGLCSFRGAPMRVTRGRNRRGAADGTTVTVTAVFPAPCPACNGSGAAPGATLRACPSCDNPRERTCALCRGAGLTSDEPCTDCGGRGETTSNRTIELTIPGRVENGDTLVARDQGGSGLRGGPPGDLHVVIDLPDPPFRSVEEFVEKKLGIRIAQEDPGRDSLTHDDVPHRRGTGMKLDEVARRELDDAVRREAIRLGLLPADDSSAEFGRPAAGESDG